jgi:cobalamin-dependent methionine synthase I
LDELFAEKYQGKRPAVGYPSLPDQSICFLLSDLLDFPSLGIKLTENGAMIPHASTCGFMFSHPAACHFSVGNIGEDQLLDYARRRDVEVHSLRKFLRSV